MKRSRLWLLFPILSVFMIIFAFWLSRQEGSYNQTTELLFKPVQDTFTIELLAEGKYMEPHVSDGDAELMWESAAGNGKSYLRIEGKLTEHQLGEPIALRIESDSGNEIREMEILSVGGISAAGCQIAVVKDHTWPLYVGFTLALIAAMAAMLSGSFGVKKKRQKFAYALELAEGLRDDPSTGGCFKDGQRYFLAVERMCIVDTLSGMFFVWISVLWVYRRSYSPGWSRAISGYLLAMAGFLIITYFLRIYRNRIMLRPLLCENRPLSASVTCLLAGINGIGSMKERAISLHNAAVGLYRSGRVREALTLEELAWKLAGKHKGAMLCFLHSDLRSVCLRCLGEEQAAEREELKLEIMLEETPWFCKNKDIQMRSLSAKIRGLISKGDLEQAEIEGNYYLNRCRDDYHRLPMLAMMAEVKEILEKPLEAEDLRKCLLRYSPENNEVLKAMAYGPCTYSYTRLKVHDFIGIILRTIYVLAVMFFLFQLSDVATHAKGQESSPAYTETEMPPSAGLDNRETTPTALKETVSEEPVDSIVLKAADFSITYPENWDGLYIEKPLDGGGISVFQKSSFEQNGDGLLFSIRIFNNGDYVNEPDYEILGYDGPIVYAMTLPTDVTFLLEDEQVRQEYEQMVWDIEPIKYSIRIDSESARYDGSEFIFPNSSDSALNEADLLNLSAQRLRIAKNEIYARYRRRFADMELQQYFNSCSWYEGKIEPSEFTDDLLNELEKKNVQLIQKQQERME